MADKRKQPQEGPGGDESSDSEEVGVVGEDEYEDHYDPGGDEDDLEQLTKSRASALGLSVAQVMRMRTDAILSCPGCFTTVCSFGSRRHARNRNQYRAELAENVVAHTDEAPLDSAAGEACYRVSCAFCGTDVGVQGAEGQRRVYHFNHVLPSEA